MALAENSDLSKNALLAYGNLGVVHSKYLEGLEEEGGDAEEKIPMNVVDLVVLLDAASGDNVLEDDDDEEVSNNKEDMDEDFDLSVTKEVNTTVEDLGEEDEYSIDDILHRVDDVTYYQLTAAYSQLANQIENALLEANYDFDEEDLYHARLAFMDLLEKTLHDVDYDGYDTGDNTGYDDYKDEHEEFDDFKDNEDNGHYNYELDDEFDDEFNDEFDEDYNDESVQFDLWFGQFEEDHKGEDGVQQYFELDEAHNQFEEENGEEQTEMDLHRGVKYFDTEFDTDLEFEEFHEDLMENEEPHAPEYHV